MAPRIIISHGGCDERAAKVLADTLSRISLNQVDIWFSSDPSPSGGFRPGEVWQSELASKLQSSKITLVLLTPASLDRPWLYFESGCGFSNRKGQVIPLCLGMPFSEVRPPLTIFQCFEINDVEGLTLFCRKLFNLLKIRFDEQMSSRILRAAAKTLNSLSALASTSSVKVENVRSLKAKLDICFEVFATEWQNLSIPVHKINQTGVICDVNKKWLEVFGYQREEVIGKPADFLMTSESAELAMLLVIPKFWETGFCQKVSYQYKKKNGAIVDVVLNCVATTDDKGMPCSLSFVQPIADSLTLRRVREDSNWRFRRKLSERAIGFYEMGLFGELTRVNPYLLEVLGYVKETDVLGKNYREVVHAESAEMIYQACHQMYTKRVQKSVRVWDLRCINGRTVKVKTATSLITQPNGKALGFRGTIQVLNDNSVKRRETPHKPRRAKQSVNSKRRIIRSNDSRTL